MRDSNFDRRGVILLSSLAILVVVTMFVAALLKTSEKGLFRTSHYRDGVRAEQAARAGINHLLAVLEADKAFGQPLEGQLEGASYTVSFDAGTPYFSVNNLSSDTVASQKSFQGYEVAPRTADLIVVGSCGLSRRALRVVVQQGFSSLRSVAAGGRVTLSGDVLVDGVKSVLPPPGQSVPDPAPGGILSKHRTSSAGGPAISWSSGSSFNLGELSRLETAPADSGLESVSANLRALHSDRIIDEGGGDTVPDIDVAAKVAAGLSSPPLAPGGSTMHGYVFVDQARSVHGGLTVQGDLVLSEGTLYIDGDLVINGGVEGTGSIFVRGDVTVTGGNAVVQTSASTGTALMAGGDITLQGINAEGYLDTLLGADAKLSRLRELLELYESATAPEHFWSLSVALAKHDGALPSGSLGDLTYSAPWVSPFPGPDGTHNHGFTNGAIPAVILNVKAAPGYSPADPRAQKVVRALEEMQYFFRHNKHNVRRDGEHLVKEDGTQLLLESDYSLRELLTGNLISLADFLLASPNSLLTGNSPSVPDYWDDLGLDDKYWTHDRLRHNANLSREYVSLAPRTSVTWLRSLD